MLPNKLFIAVSLLLLGMLSSHGIWTEEYRWQSVCAHMIASHDYFHPYLNGKPYYDKPLLSYWLIIFPAQLFGGLNFFWLRLPSVISAGLTIWATYQLGTYCFYRRIGLLAAWLLITTFYFVFWARVASADMLNVAFVVLPVLWLVKHPGFQFFKNNLIFFLLLSLGALLKGLIAPVLAILILAPLLFTLLLKQAKFIFSIKTLLAALIALFIYLVPFILSSYTQANYGENGLLLVFRENIVRFFHPFDHQAPWYTYFIYVPLYTLPWIFLVIFFLRGSQHAKTARDGAEADSLSTRNLRTWGGDVAGRSKRIGHILDDEEQKKISSTQKIFTFYAPFIIFIFLSLSGSRRSYYILPIVPFVMLSIAIAWDKKFGVSVKPNLWLYRAIGVIYLLLIIYFLIIQPIYFYHIQR